MSDFKNGADKQDRKNSSSTAQMVVLIAVPGVIVAFFSALFVAERGLGWFAPETSGFYVFMQIIGAAGALIIGYLLYIRTKAIDETARLAVRAQEHSTASQTHTVFVDAVKLLGHTSRSAQRSGIQTLVKIAENNPRIYLEQVINILVDFANEACTEHWWPISEAMEDLNYSDRDQGVARKILRGPWPRTPLISWHAARGIIDLHAEYIDYTPSKEALTHFGEMMAVQTHILDMLCVEMELCRMFLDRAQFSKCTFKNVDFSGFVRIRSRVTFTACNFEETKLSLGTADSQLQAMIAGEEYDQERAKCIFKNCTIGNNVTMNGKTIPPSDAFSGSFDLDLFYAGP